MKEIGIDNLKAYFKDVPEENRDLLMDRIEELAEHIQIANAETKASDCFKAAVWFTVEAMHVRGEVWTGVWE